MLGQTSCGQTSSRAQIHRLRRDRARGPWGWAERAAVPLAGGVARRGPCDDPADEVGAAPFEASNPNSAMSMAMCSVATKPGDTLTTDTPVPAKLVCEHARDPVQRPLEIA